MLFVILGHTWRVIHCPLPEWLSLFILSFNMAIFVIMTGYTSVKSIDRITDLKSLWDYFQKITKRILVPSAVFSLAMSLFLAIVKFILTKEISYDILIWKCILLFVYIICFYFRERLWGKCIFEFLCILAIPLALNYSPFWFFSMIWCVCLAVAIASYVYRIINFVGGYITLYVISFIVAMLIDVIYSKTSDFVHFFFIGYAFSRFKVFDKLCIIILSVISAVAGLSLIYFLGEKPMNFWEYHFIEFLKEGGLFLYFLRIIASTAICLSIIIVVKKLSNSYNTFSFWGSQTLPFYLVHGMIVTIFDKMPLTYSIDGIAYLIYAIPATFMITVVTILIIRVLMKYELTKAYCLGMIK